MCLRRRELGLPKIPVCPEVSLYEALGGSSRNVWERERPTDRGVDGSRGGVGTTTEGEEDA